MTSIKLTDFGFNNEDKIRRQIRNEAMQISECSSASQPSNIPNQSDHVGWQGCHITEKIAKRRQSKAAMDEVRNIRTTQNPNIANLRENEGERES